jgi:hypothetical protein
MAGAARNLPFYGAIRIGNIVLGKEKKFVFRVSIGKDSLD